MSTRTNKYPAPCQRCGQEVPARAGALTRESGDWVVRHRPAVWVGSPLSGSYVGGCPTPTAAVAAQDERGAS